MANLEKRLAVLERAQGSGRGLLSANQIEKILDEFWISRGTTHALQLERYGSEKAMMKVLREALHRHPA